VISRVAAGLAALVLLAGCSGGDDDGDAEEAAPGATTTVVRTTQLPPSATSGGDGFARIPSIVRTVEPSIVAIVVGGGEGSGVVWDDEGAIVTNNHVVEDNQQVEVVLASGATLQGEVEATDPLSDLAVIRVDRDGLPAATFAEQLPVVGELAVAMGNPLGFEQSVTAGIVSGLNRSIPSGGATPALVELIQTDAAISPGNSGGALVNGDAEVIGINVAYLPPQETGAVSLGFAIPSTVARSVVTQLIERGEVRRAYIGVELNQVTPEFAEAFGLGVDEGAAVERVVPGSGADEAGLQGGDVIVEIEGQPTPTVEDLYARLRDFQPGDRVTVLVVRSDDRETLEVTLGERPPE
jgi:S1-C subfamily serine protease